jgi:sugar/nucleoside kinase (ribokinase family)
MKDAGLTVSLDTNDDPDDGWEGGLDEALPYVDIFMPNEREAQKAARFDDLETAVQKLAVIVPLVVVKLGSEGAMAQRGTESFRSPSRRVQPVESVDAVGGGIVSTQAFCTNICMAALTGLSRGWQSLWRALSPPRAREESRLFATLRTVRNSSKNIGRKSKN